MGTTNTLRAWMGMGVVITGLVAASAFAQAVAGSAVEWRTSTSRLGLDPDKVQLSIGCGASLLPCRDQAQALAARSVPDVLRWTVELGVPSEPLAASRGFSSGRQGLNLSLVGRKPLFGSSFSVYGKLGTTYSYFDPAISVGYGPGPAESGYGMSFGAGVSMDVTPRLSASFGFDNRDLRLGNTGARDPVRSTSLGLQYRY
ncbi:MAG: outer membrane protein [Ramlibacter sp.]